MSYRRMTFSDRMTIFKLFHLEHLKMSGIACKTNRSASSITREMKKGQDAGYYNPFLAEYYHMCQRRYQCPKLKIDADAWKIIKPQLELRWSPDQIAKWLTTDYPEHIMSGKTIYNYIQLHMRVELKKLALTDWRQRGKKRKASKSDEKRGKIADMTLIDERPAEIAERNVPGHWEGDLIKGKDQKSAICVIV